MPNGSVHPIQALLSQFDAAWQRERGVKAPLVRPRDPALAKRLLSLYTLEQLTDWIDVFFQLRDPFIQKSGYGFDMFSNQIGKCITAKRPSLQEPYEAPTQRASRLAFEAKLKGELQ